MKKTHLLFVPLLACSMIANAQRAEDLPERFRDFVVVDAKIIAIENVRVIDGRGTPARSGQTILINDGRIERIGNNLVIPDGAQTVDGRGLTALPGLVMMHEHLSSHVNVMAPDPPYLKALLGYGVTTARTAGSPSPMLDLGIKQLIDERRLIGPDLDISSPFISAPSWVSKAFPMLPPHDYKSSEDIRMAARYWANRGVTSFKAFMGLGPDQLRALVEVASELKIKVAAHLCVTTATEAARIGIDSIEHGLLYMKELYPEEVDQPCPRFRDHFASVAEIDVHGPKAHSVITTLVENDVAVTPTFSVWSTIACVENLPRTAAKRLLSEKDWADWSGSVCSTPNFIGLPDTTRIQMLRNAMTFARLFYESGGLLLAGSDDISGLSSQFELELFVDAGFTPLEAIKIATHNGALYLERLDDIGTLESGKRADILLVRGRPDENILDLRNIETVIKNGIGYNSMSLIDSIAGELQL